MIFSNKGAVIGILKIGNKKLFVYDTKGRVHEMEPTCVLDFYVHESRQRMGCGKLLFEYFLKVNRWLRDNYPYTCRYKNVALDNESNI